MSEESNQANPTGTSSGSSSTTVTRTKLAQEINDLRQVLVKEMDKFKAKTKEILNTSNSQGNNHIKDINQTFKEIIHNQEKYTFDQLQSLRESLEGQLESLGGYTNQLVEDDELKLVNSLEASLTNVADITTAQIESLKQLYNKVSEIAGKASEKSVDIAKARNQKVKEELKEALELNKEELSSSMTSLQAEFRDEMNTKIENVFMGVKMTKEGINGIIRDTLSRLEENLSRLTQGIDENFTKEVGEAQDLIHRYEGKLQDAISDTQEKYGSMMESILAKHSQTTQKSLDTMSEELNRFKQTIMSDIEGLNSEQKQLFDSATKQLEEQIAKSKANVIESHGTLRDELDKMLSANRESIKETVSGMKSNSDAQMEKMDETLDRKLDAAKSSMSKGINEAKSGIDQTANNMSDHIKQRINRADAAIKEFKE